MKSESEINDVADSWIAITANPDGCSDENFDLGFSINSLAYDDPERAWGIINRIMDKLDDYFFEDGFDNNQINLAANLGAGPLETLLSQHGANFIDRVEQSAASEKKMRWILGCIWKNTMPEEVWQRVQRAAGSISR
jgi:hypothetical protein